MKGMNSHLTMALETLPLLVLVGGSVWAALAQHTARAPPAASSVGGGMDGTGGRERNRERDDHRMLMLQDLSAGRARDTRVYLWRAGCGCGADWLSGVLPRALGGAAVTQPPPFLPFLHYCPLYPPQ